MDLSHTEKRWEETKKDEIEMAIVRRRLAYADDAKAELESRLTGIRRMSDIQSKD